MGDRPASATRPLNPGDSSCCVVIPTRNRPELLRVALQSVLQQEVEELEVVVVDDASSPPVISWLGPSDPRVRVLRNETPRGPAAARNQGVTACRARYLAFLDDDDRYLPGKLSACLECLSRHPEAGAVVHRTVPHGSTATSTGRCAPVPDPVRRMLTRQPPHVDSVVVEREVHERVEFDESFPAAADLDYMLRLAQAAVFVELDRVLAVHGLYPDRVSEVALQARIAGRRHFRAKHEGLFRDPEVLAFYELRMGHLQRRAGHRRESLAAFGRALRHRPIWAAGWKGLATVFLPAGFRVRLGGE